MFKFELKKISKKNTFIFIIVSCLIFSIYISSDEQYYELEYPMSINFITPLHEIENQFSKKYYNEVFLFTGSSEFYKDYQVLHQDFLNFGQKCYELFPTSRNKKRGYSVNIREYEKEYINNYRNLRKFLEKYKDKDLELSNNAKEDLEWIFREKEIADKNGSHIVSMRRFSLSNIVHDLIMNSKFIFGLPFLFLLFFLLSSVGTEESEMGRLFLYKTLPLKNHRIIMGKIFAIVFVLFFSIIMMLFFMIFILSVRGMPLTGFKDAYRIFMEGKDGFIFGGFYLLKIISAVFLLHLFFLSVMFFIGTKTGSNIKTLLIMLFLSFFFQVLTEDYQMFQKWWNPYYLLNYPLILNGEIVFRSLLTGRGVFEPVMQTGFFPYAIFGFISLPFFALSNIKFKENKPKKLIDKVRVSSVSDFERKKIINGTPLILMTISGFIILMIMFIAPIRNDMTHESDIIGEDSYLTGGYLELLKEEESNLNYYNTDEGKREFFEQLKDKYSEGELENIFSSFIGRHERSRKYYKKNYEDGLKQQQAYKEKDGKRYYAAILAHSDEHIFGNIPSIYTGIETKKLLEKASQENVLPMPNVTFFLSQRDILDTKAQRQRYEKSIFPASHSAFFALYRMIRLDNFSPGFIILFSLFVLTGYSIDREKNDGLSLMYTQAISPKSYHKYKIIETMKVAALLLGLFYFFVMFMGLITEGIGAWNFPVIYYLKKDFTLIPLWAYLLMNYIFILAIIFFLASLSLWISIFFRERTKILYCLGAITVIGIVVSNILPSFLSQLLPFSYLDASNVCDMRVRIIKNIPDTSFILALIVIIVWGVLFNYLSFKDLSKRDMI